MAHKTVSHQKRHLNLLPRACSLGHYTFTSRQSSYVLRDSFLHHLTPRLQEMSYRWRAWLGRLHRGSYGTCIRTLGHNRRQGYAHERNWCRPLDRPI